MNLNDLIKHLRELREAATLLVCTCDYENAIWDVGSCAGCQAKLALGRAAADALPQLLESLAEATNTLEKIICANSYTECYEHARALLGKWEGGK